VPAANADIGVAKAAYFAQMIEEYLVDLSASAMLTWMRLSTGAEIGNCRRQMTAIGSDLTEEATISMLRLLISV
jgi:hypothetical protein